MAKKKEHGSEGQQMSNFVIVKVGEGMKLSDAIALEKEMLAKEEEEAGEADTDKTEETDDDWTS